MLAAPLGGMMTALPALLVGLLLLASVQGTQIWAEYAQSLPVIGFTATDAYQLKIFGSGTAGMYQYLNLTQTQALRVRAQLFDLMVSKGLGVDQALYSNSDPAAKLFVDLAKDDGYATGYTLKPSVAILESVGYIGPYYRNKTLYPSVVYPQIGDPDVDSRVYSFFEAGYSLVTIKPINLPYLGRIDLGSSILNAIIRFVNLDAPAGKQMYELRTPLLRTPQPGLTVLGAALPAGLDDGTNAAGTVAGEALIVATGTEVGTGLWVARNLAYFAFPSVSAAGYNASSLGLGVFPKLSVEGYNPAFTG